MKLRVTNLSNSSELVKGEYLVGNNYYYVSKDIAGTVVELKDDDDWLDGELAWVSRSEVPFITAIRLSQVSDDPDGSNWGINPNPIISKYGPPHGLWTLEKLPEFNYFPDKKKCLELIKQLPRDNNSPYKLASRSPTQQNVELIYKKFPYEDDLLIRAGACLHKAHLLESVSYMFAEEIYVNLYISFEAIIEFLKQKHNLSRKSIIQNIANVPGTGNFLEYEDEMRDFIRNNIIHPWRDKNQEAVVQPMRDVDFIFEDLPFVDWLFRQVILEKIEFTDLPKIAD